MDAPRPHNHPAALEPDALLQQCDTTRQRASGPGGQHRNKVETAVTLTHRPTGVKGAASERRSQAQNRQMALRRLRVNLALEVRGEFDPAQGPSPLWQSRARQGRLAINPDHADFPALLAEAMDLLHQKRFDLAPTATLLGITATQIVRLLSHEPRAMAWLNQHRQEQGLPPLRSR